MVIDASAGMRNTVTAPAHTSTEAISLLIAPDCCATIVTATMIGNAVVQ